MQHLYASPVAMLSGKTLATVTHASQSAFFFTSHLSARRIQYLSVSGTCASHGEREKIDWIVLVVNWNRGEVELLGMPKER